MKSNTDDKALDVMPDGGRIVIEREDGVATLVIDAPHKRNSVDGPMLVALADAARTLAGDETIALVVLRGAGVKAFCAGADLDALCASPIERSVDRLDLALADAVQALSAIPVPLIAVVVGACIGGGVQLALCADTIMARDDAIFAIPAAQAGMAYPLGALRALVARVGAPAAKDLLLFGQRWDAHAALRYGLVQHCLDASALAEKLTAMRAYVGQSPRDATIAYKGILSGLEDRQETAASLHRAFAARRAYLPKLAVFAASRKK